MQQGNIRFHSGRTDHPTVQFVASGCGEPGTLHGKNPSKVAFTGIKPADEYPGIETRVVSHLELECCALCVDPGSLWDADRFCEPTCGTE